LQQHTRIVNPRPKHVLSQHDPNREQRRCSACGARDRWQRLLDGGWYCCWTDPTPTYNPTMAHVCAPVCAGAA
jgi:hypothetical protein